MKNKLLAGTTLLIIILLFFLYLIKDSDLSAVKNPDLKIDTNQIYSKSGSIINESLKEESHPESEPQAFLNNNKNLKTTAFVEEEIDKRKASDIFLNKLNKLSEHKKNYMLGLLSGRRNPPQMMNFSNYWDARRNDVIRCQEGDGGRFFFVMDLTKKVTIFFDQKEQKYIQHIEGIEKTKNGSDSVYKSNGSNNKLFVHYQFIINFSEEQQIGEGTLRYKYEKADKIKEKVWPFTCEITP
ncbi:MAG: hypothetical protein CME70_11185 [Halobacteriovorax sp.]|nr:hypothetical protein [Halobacteriovorax sp.]|tara:strand:- start:9853 stop:10572 length:720 start_codon:yes stop_codon:yes gene_type:complete